MSIMQFLNGVFHGSDDDEEIMSKFLREQGGNASDFTREQLLQAFEAEKRGDLDQAEQDYNTILDSLDNSQVVSERLQRIRRRRDNG